jgi:hypothetical protein
MSLNTGNTVIGNVTEHRYRAIPLLAMSLNTGNTVIGNVTERRTKSLAMSTFLGNVKAQGMLN